MFSYSTLLKRAEYAGGAVEMDALAAHAIELSNESYENSEVAVRLNLVHTAQTADGETGNFSKDLIALQASEDGQYDEAHKLRDAHYADMVVLMVKPGAYCGIGYSPSTVDGIRSGNYAFSLVAANCVNYYSFQHEIGHNLGLQHDSANAPSNTAFDGAYGHRWDGNKYRSVMAYSPEFEFLTFRTRTFLTKVEQPV